MKIENLCNFYASEYHLGIILMEYLNKNNYNNNVITFFENGIEDEIKALKDKYKYNIDNNINFKSTKLNNDVELNFTKDEVIIISGNKKYMDDIENFIKYSIKKAEKNDLINKSNNIQPKFIENNKITIIKCYNFNDFELNEVEDVLKENDNVLYTTGVEKAYNID